MQKLKQSTNVLLLIKSRKNQPNQQQPTIRTDSQLFYYHNHLPFDILISLLSMVTLTNIYLNKNM